MTIRHRTPAPPRPQVPPTRAAASDPKASRRAARGSLPWTTGTASAVLDESSAR
jgi:alkanesulfonate monooxygenase SsuD/methylene tetrahydromethanopterin reductase-like flavin-dependent oxidoreductase (luciferase family)